MDEHLRVLGETNVFAVGDVSDADRDMAGIATQQAGVVAANVGALIAGEGELISWETFPPLIAIPLGPEGGAGFIGDGVADPATIAQQAGVMLVVGSTLLVNPAARVPAVAKASNAFLAIVNDAIMPYRANTVLFREIVIR